MRRFYFLVYFWRIVLKLKVWLHRAGYLSLTSVYIIHWAKIYVKPYSDKNKTFIVRKLYQKETAPLAPLLFKFYFYGGLIS